MEYCNVKRIWLFILLLFVNFQAFANQPTAADIVNSPHVVFINPGYKDDPFYQLVDRFMRASAEDLNIDWV